LQHGDSAGFVSRYEQTRIETRLRVSPAEPDYFGNSMWEFRLGERIIEAKMLVEEWLQRFRRQEIPLQPGDALRAIVRIETARGFEGHDVVPFITPS
jgi:hypothetical protein